MNDTTLHLTSAEAAQRLAVSPRTLEAWRRRGVGPAYRRFGRCVRYAAMDLDEFARRAAAVAEAADGGPR